MICFLRTWPISSAISVQFRVLILFLVYLCILQSSNQPYLNLRPSSFSPPFILIPLNFSIFPKLLFPFEFIITLTPVLALFQNIELNFQMKQRRSKPTNPKKINLIPAECSPINYTSIANKMPSAHTKMSTNHTIHSNTQHQLHDTAGKKGKKGNLRNSKENPATGERELPKSKSVKRFKINIQAASPQFAQPEISYREYCLVDENFVPVTTSDQHKKIEDFLSQTAPSTCDFTFNYKLASEGKNQLRKRAISTVKTSDNNQKIERIDISTSIKEIKLELVNQEISASPEYVQVGLQYSQRKQELKQVLQQPEKSINTLPQPSAQAESLSQLLFKLQFSHLPDEKSFSTLTSNEKQHFSQLLESLVSKLKVKPQLKPIDFSSSEQVPEQTYKHPYQQQAQLALQNSYEQLEKLVCMREYYQMNWIQSNPTEQQEDQVNTSLFSVVNFLCHLFCYVQVQYSEEFVYMIQKVYGYTFREKYRRITRRIPIIPDRKFRVVEQAAFLDFINQSNAYSNTNELVHYKAIFDSFNEHLQEYRPFYLGNGEQFPWAIRMFSSMSEYSINEDSLQIIFQQAKEKMIEWCSNLCGLMVDFPSRLGKGSPLELKRAEREEKMIRAWLKEENFEKDGIELCSTQALHDVSEDIYLQLVQELLQEMTSF